MDERNPHGVPIPDDVVSPPGGYGGRRPSWGGGGGGGGQLLPPAIVPQGQRVIFPPEFMRPKDGKYFQAGGTTNIAGPSAFTTLGGTFQVPPSSMGIVRDVNLGVETMLATTNIVWRIRVDGSPVEGWNALTLAPRASAFVSASFLPESTYITVPSGAVVDVQAIVNDAVAYNVTGQVRGWFYPQSVYDDYYGV